VRPSGLRWAVQVLGRRPGPAWPWVRWWTVRLPTVQRGRCRSVRMTPAAVAGCPHHRTVRTIGVDKAAPPVRLSGRSVSAGLSWLISSEQARSAAAAHRAGTATAGRPRSFCGGRLCPPRDPVARAVSGWLGNRTPPQRPLSAAASGTAAGCPDGVVHRGHCGQSYRKSLSSRCPLVGRCHGRSAWLS
jgi:hypothetical protein